MAVVSDSLREITAAPPPLALVGEKISAPERRRLNLTPSPELRGTLSFLVVLAVIAAVFLALGYGLGELLG